MESLTDGQAKAETIMAMAEMFRAPLSTAAVRMYVAALADLTPQQVAMACAKLSTEAKFRPVPSEIREAAGMNPTKAGDRAVLAFQTLKTHCSRVGAFRSVDFDDPLINATVRNLGGWKRACEMPESEFDTWYRKDFLAVYELFCRTGASPEMTQHLAGESEQHNRANGFLEAANKDLVKVATGLPWAGQPVGLLGGQAAKPALALEGPK